MKKKEKIDIYIAWNITGIKGGSCKNFYSLKILFIKCFALLAVEQKLITKNLPITKKYYSDCSAT